MFSICDEQFSRNLLDPVGMIYVNPNMFRAIHDPRWLFWNTKVLKFGSDKVCSVIEVCCLFHGFSFGKNPKDPLNDL